MSPNAMSSGFARVAAQVAAVLALASPVCAQLPSDVLTQSSRTTITRADFDAEIESIPPAMRGEFTASAPRVSKMVNSMLESKTLAAEARASGLDKDPGVERRVKIAVERALAQARAEQIEREAAASFDRRRDEFAARARETYVVNKAKYATPEQVKAAHILVRIEKRSKEEALKLANDIRAKAMAAGADFSALAREYSEDASAKTNGGQLGWFAAAQMDPAFAKGAFALTKPGEISEPVLSSFGYHIIRFEERRPSVVPPYEAVRDRILDEIKREYVAGQKNAATDGIFRDPTLKINQPAIDALVTKVDPESFKKAGSAAAAK